MRRARWMTVVFVLLAAGCSSGAAAIADPVPPVIGDPERSVVPTPVPPTPAPGVTPDPTATPVVVGDDDLIAAAIAAFDVERGQDYVAWDHLGAEVLGDRVTLHVCAWDGETAYDEAVQVDVSTRTAADGAVDASVISVVGLVEDCLNTELIESAIAFIDEHDEYWAGVLEDPSTFDPAVRAPEIFNPGNLELAVELVAGWVADGVHWEGKRLVGDLPDSSVVDVLWRSYDGRDDIPVLAVLACRDMDPRNGLYRGGLLLDDGTSENSVGTHNIYEYLLLRQDGEWRVTGGNSIVWADCFFAEDWLDGVNGWRPDPVLWQVWNAR